ncbi:MAG: type II toxin-antitoxin system VapC family toxin [Anaerolineae bacterium]|nr:type II toxin-antitoxin system VapC family toxin [Anaerolineae bacterium]
MIQIGIDTSVLIGILDPKDAWHPQAMDLKEALKMHEASVAVFDCVLAEAISTMARRIHEQRREQDLDKLLDCLQTEFPADAVLWILPDVPMLFAETIELVRSSSGVLNFNDALIALSCRNRGIPFLASFDRDFDHVAWLTRVATSEDLASIA